MIPQFTILELILSNSFYRQTPLIPSHSPFIMIIDLLPRLRSLRVVLASASPRRAELLTQIGLTFNVKQSTFPENLSQTLSVDQYVEQTCRAKAVDVMQIITNDSANKSNPDYDIIISADTVVVHNQRIMEKPKCKSQYDIYAITRSINHIPSTISLSFVRFDSQAHTFIVNVD